ncbi:MAG: GTP cyclohydrolase II [Chloroflexota bacterium]|nr:GTP cyclohydrolase II [Chloroflexota bacterium]MDE2920163.1 GTP cyclohydrolase II [Chloroflexota bacterium]
MNHDALATAIARIRGGGIVAVVDDGLAQPDLDLVAAGENLRADTLRHLQALGNGEIYAPATTLRLDELGLSAQPPDSGDPLARRPALAISVGLAGASAESDNASRVAVVRALASDRNGADFRSPGPVTPIRAREGGVLRRLGHTEAAVDLAVLAGFEPVAVLTHVDTPPPAAFTDPWLPADSGAPAIPVVRISQIVHYRRASERVVYQVAAADLPTAHGAFKAVAFHDTTTGEDHVALTLGDLGGDSPPLVRVHSECLTGDVFGSMRCDCGDQLDAALSRIADEGRGVVLYMRQEGRGIGLANKLRAYELQDRGLDTVDANRHLGFAADLRDYGVGAQILRELGITDLRLLTNNPKKTAGFRAYGLKVVEQLALAVEAGAHNRRYLETKRARMGHEL